jgi:hypothetical protein
MLDLAQPVVTFSADIAPILAGSCGLSSACHSDNAPSDQGYLGSNAAMTLQQNVNVAATREPAMKRIAPGDPEHSFLMHKVDGTLQCSLLSCAVDESCGDPQPQGATTLSQSLRDELRRWIAQGAKGD